LSRRKSRNEGWWRRSNPVTSFGTSRIAYSLLRVCITHIPEILITFASEAAGRGENKIIMLPRILRYIIHNRTFSGGLNVVGMEF
jgi:hypothetical protein